MKLGANMIGQSKGVAQSTLASIQRGPDIQGKKRYKSELINLFLMATAWGFGASLDSQIAKVQLSELIIGAVLENAEVEQLQNEDLPIPTKDMCLFDFRLDLETNRWVPWDPKKIVEVEEEQVI